MSNQQLVGHRGCRKLAIDNSYKAFEIAKRAGLKAIETDIRITADGYLVLNHDDNINGLIICEHGLDELRVAHPELLTLTDAKPILESFDWLQLEIKPVSEPRRTALLKQLLTFDSLIAKATLTSFDQGVLETALTLDRHLSVGVLEEHNPEKMIERARALDTLYVLPSVELTTDNNLKKWVKEGFKVSIFTQNSVDGARHMLSLGAHSIITDNPHLFDEGE